MRKKSTIILVVSVLLLSACATSQVKIETSPEGANVKLTQSSKSSHSIGITPLLLNSSNASDLFRNPIQITIEKDGYESQSIFIPQTSVAATGDVSIVLRRDPANNLDTTVNAVAQAQRLIFKKDYSGAEKLLSAQINITPSLAVLHSLLGNVYYLQKKLNDALTSYRQSDRLEPNNLEVSKMIAKLRSFNVNQEKN